MPGRTHGRQAHSGNGRLRHVQVANRLVDQEPVSDFKCFCTFSAEYLNEGVDFQPAAAFEPPAIFGRSLLSEDDKATIDSFIRKKPPRTFDDGRLHQPLLEGEIRVLELYPATHDAPLKGNLHVVSTDFEYPKIQPLRRRIVPGVSQLGFEQREVNHAISLITKKAVWYTALSYTWGAPVFDNMIGIGHERINITSGLATAMRHLRSMHHSVFLWIDQICINQPDLKEKETQVPLMRTIYRGAKNTLIWLGEEEGTDPHLAIKTLQDVHAALQMTKSISTDDFPRLGLPSTDDRSWWGIRELLRRPWFTRTWTIQEACLSRHCYVQCGRTVVPWGDIANWCQTLHDTGLLRWLSADETLDRLYSKTEITVPRPAPAGATALIEIQERRSYLLGLQSMRGAFLNSLVLARSAGASNPKDKVYGILGIATPDDEIKPDYSDNVTYREVYHRTCTGEVTRNPFSLPLLSCVDAEDPLRPSWIPDWSTARVTQDFGYHSRVWAIYMAGGKLPVDGSTRIPVALSENKQRITVRGKIFDEIAALSPVSKDPVLCIDAFNMTENEWACYTDLADNSVSNTAYSVPTDTVYNAFFQTLMAGRDGTGISALSPDHSEVFSLILDSTTGRKPSLPGQTYSIRREKGHFTLASLVAQKGAKVRKPVQVLEDMRIALRAALHMRRFAVTRRGYFALVPRGARAGDEVVVFERACVPFVVRKVVESSVDNEIFELVGETYVHGIMKGESMGMQELTLRDVTLV